MQKFPAFFTKVHLSSGNKFLQLNQSFIFSFTNKKSFSSSGFLLQRTMSNPTIFDKIVAGIIPSTKVYEDDVVYAFRDINPVAPVHILVVPKNMGRLSRLQNATEEDKGTLGHLMWAAAEIARREGLAPGFRLVVNDGDQGGQTVHHLHLHIIGGKQLSWPPGTQ